MEENKVVLKEEDLEKANGGYEVGITKLDAGDVFIHRDLWQGVVITKSLTVSPGNKKALCKVFTIDRNGPIIVNDTIQTIHVDDIYHTYTYSPELTGKISY